MTKQKARRTTNTQALSEEQKSAQGSMYSSTTSYPVSAPFSCRCRSISWVDTSCSRNATRPSLRTFPHSDRESPASTEHVDISGMIQHMNDDTRASKRVDMYMKHCTRFEGVTSNASYITRTPRAISTFSYITRTPRDTSTVIYITRTPRATSTVSYITPLHASRGTSNVSYITPASRGIPTTSHP